MLDRTNYGFCHEFYTVEKAIEVVVEQGGEPLQLRIEAPEGFLISRLGPKCVKTPALGAPGEGSDFRC
jgi:hypothetical protein